MVEYLRLIGRDVFGQLFGDGGRGPNWLLVGTILAIIVLLGLWIVRRK